MPLVAVPVGPSVVFSCWCARLWVQATAQERGPLWPPQCKQPTNHKHIAGALAPATVEWRVSDASISGSICPIQTICSIQYGGATLKKRPGLSEDRGHVLQRCPRLAGSHLDLSRGQQA